MDGGFKVPITDHPADDKEPRWSPDGQHIIFLSDRHGSWALWGVDVRDGKPEGNPFLVLEGMEDAELASCTNKGLVSRTSAAIRDIYTLEIDPQSLEARGKPRILDFAPSGSSFRPQWSPDGKYLAFTRFPLPTEKFPISFFVMPSKGGEARKYDLNMKYWQWLPDSSGLWFLGVDDQKRPLSKRLELESGQWKTRSIPVSEYSKPLTVSVALSGDGKALYYVKEAQDRSEAGICAYEIETGQQRYLLHTQPDEPQYLTLDASYDHKRLVTGLWGRILILDIETGHVERLEYKKENLRFPAWSPDGKVKCLDVSRYFPRGMRIMFTLDWSPDGKTIAYDTFKIISETNLIQNLIPKK